MFFLFWPRFYVFNVFKNFPQRFFLFKKPALKNPIKSFEKHFWNHRKKVIGYSDVFYLEGPNILNKKFFN